MQKFEIGVSTASLFKRMYNEEAVGFLNSIGIPVCEMFLGTYREYTDGFAKLLKQNKGDLLVHSVHTLNTHFEPQLFSANPRALEDAYDIARGVLSAAKILGAKYYTFHGVARVKRKIAYTDFKRIGGLFTSLCDECEKYGVTLALENVEWAYYNHPSFFSSVKKFCPKLKGTLDIKQARDAGEGYVPYLEEMGEDIVTVHLSDVDENGKLCLPGKGTFDFKELFSRLIDKGFSGAALIEVYNENYDKNEELKDSYEYLSDVLESVR